MPEPAPAHRDLPTPAAAPSCARTRAGWLALGLALGPALAAIWAVPGFVTQDGPAHLYNAQILAAALGADAAYRDVYRVRWDLLPNWAGHLAAMAALAALPVRWAGAALMGLTLVLPAAAVLGLRRRVAGARGGPMAAALAALIGLNVTWLLGFWSFLLGATLFPVTLGAWWAGRDRPGPGRALGLAALLTLGYFCHPISLGLTVVGLLVLAATTPGPARIRARRLSWTAASLLPLVPLGLVYRGLMRRGGAVDPLWENLGDPWTIGGWLRQLAWVDPITLGVKGRLPLLGLSGPGFAALSPLLWLLIALGLLAATTLRGRGPGGERRGWGLLAALLILGGAVAPDTLGASHGNYLQQRVVLLGLAALVPWLELDAGRPAGRLAAAALAVAVALQSAWVWDYALESDRRVGPFLAARPFLARGERVGTLLGRVKGWHRANPLLHADGLLGLGTGAILWANYESAHYYFPVQVRDDVPHPPPGPFEQIALRDAPGEADARRALWARLLAEHHADLDVLALYDPDPALDPLHAPWFGPEPAVRIGPLRLVRRRPGADD